MLPLAHIAFTVAGSGSPPASPASLALPDELPLMPPSDVPLALPLAAPLALPDALPLPAPLPPAPEVVLPEPEPEVAPVDAGVLSPLHPTDAPVERSVNAKPSPNPRTIFIWHLPLFKEPT